MSSRIRHFKEQKGHFYTRMAVPARLVAIIGKTQLQEALGSDRKAAERKHYAVVTKFQNMIATAEKQLAFGSAMRIDATPSLPPLTTDDIGAATWPHYTSIIEAYEQKRKEIPTRDQRLAELERYMERIRSGEFTGAQDSPAMINAFTDYALMRDARLHDQDLRRRRLVVIQKELASDDFRVIGQVVDEFLEKAGLSAPRNSGAWMELARALARAEIEGLKQTLERSVGNFGSTPTDPIVAPTAAPQNLSKPVKLKALFDDYVTSRQRLGHLLDGGKRWKPVVEHLVSFLGHGDARKITKKNLIEWRDNLLGQGRSTKTVADVYLACIRAVLNWAFENDRLPSNEAEHVRQEVAKTVRSREKGYTTPEAIKVLNASINYKPAAAANRANRESAHITAAKRWVPLLCAFTGARITEMTQLRKEDLREEGGRWIIRITPDAGSVKTSQFRDVPVHRQAIAFGFIDFVKAAGPGPLFHGANLPDRFLKNARVTAGRLSEWLNDSGLVPKDVQPNYGWRHRLKTQGIELGLSERTMDAIQGHAGRTASDGYGDVTVAAKVRVIDALPDYLIEAEP